MPNLANIESCTGCSACANVCPKNAIGMVPDNEGFLLPVVDESKCVNCGLCERSCPALSSDLPWGNLEPDVYAGWHKQDRSDSSSGGLFSSFARMVLKDGGSVFGSYLSADLNCFHKEISTIEDLCLLRGSKYVQSEIGSVYKTLKKRLDDGRKVLFCGTSCQVAGLKCFLRKDYENLLTIDLVCHGVPSNLIFKSYVKKLQKKLNLNKEIERFEFRNRDGWGMKSAFSVDQEHLKPLYGVDALYQSAFDKSALFRKSCYSCTYTRVPRMGDISLADFWGIGRYGIPFSHDVMKGVSLVLINTSKGEKALCALDDDTFIEKRTLEEALIENHNLKATSFMHHRRNEIVRDFLDEDISLQEIDKRYHLVEHSLKSAIKEISSKLGFSEVAKRIYNKVKTL